MLKSVGFSGGLKGCERKAGIDRDELTGLDGYHAPILWQEFKDKRDEKALETLLAYNCQDTVNLETLMVMAYNLKLKDTPFHGIHDLPLPIAAGDPLQSRPGDGGQGQEYGGMVVVLGGRHS